ncbi:MAG: DUF5317 domain-containing protein [Chloroflexi bacterium]|nr:DUF5317 domain-containing protein [Chloroflexota bacterium]
MLTSSVLLGLAVALLRRGDLRLLAQVRFRFWWLLVGAFALKLALARFGGEGLWGLSAYAPGLHLLVYGLLLAPLAANRRLPWMGLLIAGTALNCVAVAANGGRMPVVAEALALLGKTRSLEQLRAGADVIHTLASDATPLAWLGDWIPVPLPVSAVVSPGDVALALGVVLLINTVTQPVQSPAPAAGG